MIFAGLCRETSKGVFERAWSKSTVKLDCNTFTASGPSLAFFCVLKKKKSACKTALALPRFAAAAAAALALQRHHC